MAKIEHIKNKRGEVIYPVSKEGAIYDENGVLLSTKIATFITRLVDNLANYYLKSETYTKAEVDELIGAIQGFTYIVVSELPTASAETMGIVYLVPSEDPQTQNVKDEYITIRSGSIGSYTYSWEQIGSTAIDLSGYVTTEDLNAELAKYTTTANLTTLLAGKQDTIADLTSIRNGASLGATAYQKPNSGIPASDIAAGVIPDVSGKQDVIPDLSTIRSGAAAGATAYQKPGTGIPATDMASGVQTSLGKADSAYQKPSGGIPKTDLESGVQGSLELADSAVQADPIGSIVPPVDPSEFATKEEVEGLEAKVTGLQASTVISSKADATVLAGRIIANGAWNSRNDFTTLVIPISAGNVARIVGRSGYSMDFAVYSEFNGTALDETKAVQLGTVISGNVEFDKFITINASGYLATSSTSNYASQDIYSQSSFSEILEKMDEDIEDVKEDIAEVYQNLLGLPSIHGRVVWTPGTIGSSNGAILSSTVSKYTNLISVHEGDSLVIRIQASNLTNEVQVAAYDYNKSYKQAQSVIVSTESGYKIINYTVPSGVSYIRLTSKNAYADYNAAYPDDMPLISYKGGKSDFISASEFFEKGLSAAQFVKGYESRSVTMGRWFEYVPTNNHIISTRAFPKSGLEYIGVIAGKSVYIHQFDGNGAFIGTFNSSVPIRNENENWSPLCEYFLIACLNASSPYDNISDIHYNYQDGLAVKGPIVQYSSDYYDKKVSKGLFLNASVINDYENDKMAHGSRIVLDSEGNIFTLYYHSANYESESIANAEGVVLAKCNPCLLQEPSRINAMVKGETVGDFTQSSQSSPYDPNILKINSSTFRLLMVLNGGDGAFVGARDFNPATMDFDGEITPCTISYNGVQYALSSAGLNAVVDAVYSRTSGTTNVGLYPIMTSQFKSYDGKYYTFLWSLNPPTANFSTSWNGAIIRSADGISWEVFSIPTITLSWTSHTNWEAGFDILNDRAYVFFRNNDNDAPICYCDLTDGSWGDAVDLIPITLPYIGSPNQMIYADSSRPEVYAYNGYIYAMQNVRTASAGFLAKDVFRGMMCVWKLDADLNVIDYRIFQNAFGVSYFSLAIGNGFGYFAFTEDRTAKHQTEQNYNKRHIAVMPIAFGTILW